jgi:hypothetical protein
MDRRALLVGIAEYDQFESLPGCVADVAALEPLLSRHAHGAPNFDCRVLPAGGASEPRVTRDLLQQSLTELLAPGADIALFYFAGHGALVDDELLLVVADGSVDAPGVPMSSVFALIHASPIREVVVVLDCCFAGRAGAGSKLERDMSTLREGVSILAGSRGDERAAEVAGRGLFSRHLCTALAGEAADRHGRIDLASVYQHVSRACSSWEQRPIFKLNVQRLLVLREGERPKRRWSSTRRAALWGVAPAVLTLGLGAAWWPPNTERFFQDTGDEPHLCRKPISPCEFTVQATCPWGTRAVGDCVPHAKRGKGWRCFAQATATDGRATTAKLTMVVQGGGAQCQITHCGCEYVSFGELIAGGFAR